MSKNKDYARRMKKMILLKKCLYLIIVGLLCVSCADKYDQKMDCFNPANKEKYGLVLLRAIKFEEQEELRQFQKDESSSRFFTSSRVTIYAEEISEETGTIGIPGYMISGWHVSSNCKNIKEANFVVTPEYKYFVGYTPAIVKSEAFYRFIMLPEGEYYINSAELFLHHGKFIRSTYKNKQQSPLSFVVKAGKTNYIGDLYFVSPKIKDKNFFTADTYTYKLLIVDKKDKAKDFMSKYYPNIDFPFVEDTKN